MTRSSLRCRRRRPWRPGERHRRLPGARPAATAARRPPCSSRRGRGVGPAELHRGRRCCARRPRSALGVLPIESSLIGPDRGDARPAVRRAALDHPRGVAPDSTLRARRSRLRRSTGRRPSARIRRRSTSAATLLVRPPPALHPGGDDGRRGARGGGGGRRGAARDRERRGRRGVRTARWSPTTSATVPARSRGSSRSLPTRRSRAASGWRTALSFVTDHRPGALFHALGRARSERGEPRAARVEAAAELAVALPLRRRARRARVRPDGAARAQRELRTETRELRLFGSYAAEAER